MMNGRDWRMRTGDGMIYCNMFHLQLHRRSFGQGCEFTNCRSPYFRRSETFRWPSAAHQEHYHSLYDDEYNGADGPLQITHIKKYVPDHQCWHAILNELGLPSSRDSLTGTNCGVWNMAACAIDPHHQARSYSASACYAPVAERQNLHLLTNVTVLEPGGIHQVS